MQLFDMDNYAKLKHYNTILVTPEFVTRFQKYVHIDFGMPEGCHRWIGTQSRGGYGQIWHNKKWVVSSRASYAIYNGDIPYGTVICHSCDNPFCVNPAHLFVGSAADNQKDAVAKGRHSMTKKTHCPKGHKYAEINLIVEKKGSARRCRLCANESHKKWKIKKRLAS